MENTADILAKKRAWQKGDKDRRKKDGSISDRKDTADALRAGRAMEARLRRSECDKLPNALMVAICLFLSFVFMCCFVKGCHAQEIPLKASWYSISSLQKEGTYKHSKGVMANGHIFSDNGFTCATRLFPLGSMVRVENCISKSFVIVKVTDRIGKRFGKTRIDLSKESFEKIARLNEGLINVTVERIL